MIKYDQKNKIKINHLFIKIINSLKLQFGNCVDEQSLRDANLKLLMRNAHIIMLINREIQTHK